MSVTSVIQYTNGTHPQTSAAFTAEEIALEAQDLAGFLASAGADLPADVAIEAGVLLDGVKKVLGGIVARIEAAGPGC
jgi:hypothetical protein